MTIDETVQLIRAAHRERAFAAEQRKKLDLSLGSFIRRHLGWRMDIPEQQRKAIAADAKKLASSPDGRFVEIVAASKVSRTPWRKVELAAEREMRRLAETLPVWQAFPPTRGFSPLGLAIIVGEAGDLSLYATHSKLWKRMGVGLVGDAIQSRVPAGLGREASAAAWVERGYSPARRSRLYTIGASLVKLNQDGPYRRAYATRRAHTMITHPEWWSDAGGAPKLNKNGTPCSGHGSADAQRYMEKRLLRDVWRAWRRATHQMPEMASRKLPASRTSRGEIA